MSTPIGDIDEDGFPIHVPMNWGPNGSASIQNAEKESSDAVQRLREVVAEITRGRIPVPVRRGPGF